MVAVGLQPLMRWGCHQACDTVNGQELYVCQGPARVDCWTHGRVDEPTFGNYPKRMETDVENEQTVRQMIRRM